MFSPPTFQMPSQAYAGSPYGYPSNYPPPAGAYYAYDDDVYGASPTPRSSKRPSRRASHGAGTYSSPVAPGRYPTDYERPGHYYYAPPAHAAEYVSSSDRIGDPLRWSMPAKSGGRRASRSYRPAYDSSDEDLNDYVPKVSPRHHSYKSADHDRHHREKAPAYEEEEPTVRRSRARRSSHATRPTTSPKTHKSPPKTSVKAPPKATEDDRLRKRIPAGYSIKNWDPTEEPITLLGSVFDANSLGKWIYDWTVFHHGAATPMTEIAGDMWLLLIQLSGKVKRAEEAVSRIRRRDNRELVEDFLESGERLWERFRRLLKACETFMWKAARRETGKAKLSMGKSSGCEFVDSIFGRDRELERTEKLMTGMRLWSMRFDANCEEILRRPSA